MKPIRTIGVGFGFSPTFEALVAEARALADVFGASLVFMHAGAPTDEQRAYVSKILTAQNLEPDCCKVIFRPGHAHTVLNTVGEEENLDFILIGALRKETSQQQIMGSLARRFARHAQRPVMLVPEPASPPRPIDRIVVAFNETNPEKAVEAGIAFARSMPGAKLIVVKESAMKGAKQTLSQYYTQKDYQRMHEKLLQTELDFVSNVIDSFDTEGLEIYSKLVFGHSGTGIVEYANHVQADLLVDMYAGLKLGILDRLFPHDVEYALMNLPCKLFLVK